MDAVQRQTDKSTPTVGQYVRENTSKDSIQLEGILAQMLQLCLFENVVQIMY